MYSRFGKAVSASGTSRWCCEVYKSLLGRLYDLQVEHDVYDFLVTDRRTLVGVVPVNDSREPDEELLLAETADGAGVALYIDPAVLARLEASDPLGALTEENLADYCTALEGVSHFLYSIWRLECDAPVSLLELECQAEVDKYAATVFLVGEQQGGELSGAGACAALRSGRVRRPPRARAIRSLPHGAS